MTLAVADPTPPQTPTQRCRRLALWGAASGSARAALFGLGNALLELVGPVAGASEADGLRAHLEAQGEGLLGFTLGCADAAAASKLLRARGVRATPPEDGEAQSASGEHRRFRVVELSPATTRRVPVTLVERLDPIAASPTPFAPSEASALDHIVLRTADCDAALALERSGEVCARRGSRNYASVLSRGRRDPSRWGTTAARGRVLPR